MSSLQYFIEIKDQDKNTKNSGKGPPALVSKQTFKAPSTRQHFSLTTGFWALKKRLD